MKVGDLNMSQVGAGSFVNLNQSWNNVQIDAFRQSLKADSKATSTASSLNDMLQQRNLLPKDQQVVGFSGGRFFTVNTSSGAQSNSSGAGNSSTTSGTGGNTNNNAPNSNPANSNLANSNPANSGTTPPGTTNSNPANPNSKSANASNANVSLPTTNVMLDGLTNVNITNITNIQAKNVINVSGSMSAGEIRSLGRTLNGNASARQNADRLTQQLRQSGLLTPNQRVMGFSNGQVYTGPSMSNSGSGGSGSVPEDDDTDTTSGTNKQPGQK